MLQQDSLAEHADYRNKFEIAAQLYKQEAREITNVEVAQSQAQLHASYSSALMQAHNEVQVTQGLAEQHVQHIKTEAQQELVGAQQVIVQQAEHHVRTQREAVVTEAKQALHNKDSEIQNQQRTLAEEARAFAVHEQNQMSEMQNELRLKSRELAQQIDSNQIRASGDAELIANLQQRLGTAELQTRSLQDVIRERSNEDASKQNTLYQKQNQLIEELVQSQRSFEDKDRILNERITQLQKLNEEKERHHLEEQQQLQQHLKEAQSAYNNLAHALQTGGPVLEDDDEELYEEEDVNQPSASSGLHKNAPPFVPHIPRFYDVGTPRTIPKVDLPETQNAGGDAKQENNTDTKVKEADTITFESIQGIRAIRYWKTKPSAQYQVLQLNQKQPFNG